MRKTFGGCLASNKLKGFASEGREVPESAHSRNGNGDDNSYGGRGLSAEEEEEDEDGPWTEGSESGDEESSSSSDEEEEDTKEAEDRRVEDLYNIATGGGDGGAGETASVVHEESTTAVDTTTAGAKEAAPAKMVTVEAGTAAPCSEPTADEVIPLSALPALAKKFAVANTPSEEPPQPDLAASQCSQAAETAALQEGGNIAAPVPPS